MPFYILNITNETRGIAISVYISELTNWTIYIYIYIPQGDATYIFQDQLEKSVGEILLGHFRDTVD